MRTLFSTSLALALSALAATASAHQPFFAGPENDDAEGAFPLPDPSISRVVYADLSCDQGALWVSVPAERGQDLFLQLGLPVLESLANYRPSLALVGPGLPAPETNLPFSIPEGSGAIVFSTADVAEPEVYHEPFTKTDSWILLETTERVPATGTYWLVGFDPEARRGRLWIATGTVEQFEPGDDIKELLAKVRAFYAPLEDGTLGEPCASPPPPPAIAVAGGGCAASGAEAAGGAAVAGLLLTLTLAQRRRPRTRPRPSRVRLTRERRRAP